MHPWYTMPSSIFVLYRVFKLSIFLLGKMHHLLLGSISLNNKGWKKWSVTVGTYGSLDVRMCEMIVFFLFLHPIMAKKQKQTKAWMMYLSWCNLWLGISMFPSNSRKLPRPELQIKLVAHPGSYNLVPAHCSFWIPVTHYLFYVWVSIIAQCFCPKAN